MVLWVLYLAQKTSGAQRENIYQGRLGRNPPPKRRTPGKDPLLPRKPTARGETLNAAYAGRPYITTYPSLAIKGLTPERSPITVKNVGKPSAIEVVLRNI